MNYTELTNAIKEYTDNTETTFVNNIPNFVRQTEERIYRSILIPELRKNVTTSLSTSNRFLAKPTDFLAVFSIAVVDGSSNYSFLLPKDVNFIREAYPAKYYFTVDYTDSEIADDPAQHKQSHVLELLDAGEWTGNIVALPNNRVRVTHPAWFETGQGAPDFLPSQHIHYSKSDLDYVLDVNQIFDNLYADKKSRK